MLNCLRLYRPRCECPSPPPFLIAPATTHTAHAAASHYYSSSAWLTPTTTFENEALISALRASMSPNVAASYLATPSSSSTSSVSEPLFGGHDTLAPTSRPSPTALGRPKVDRISKRKPQLSHRAPTTYISADLANFRRMVQETTGFRGPSTSVSESISTAVPNRTALPACMLPTLDTSAFLLDRSITTPGPGLDDKGSSGGASAIAAAKGEDDSSVLLELEAMVCAPTGMSGISVI